MDKVQFVANLGQRASAVMMSGDGTRCIITIEAYQTQAAAALSVLQFSGGDFLVTIETVPRSFTKLNDENKQSAEREAIRVGRRRAANR